MPLVCVNARVNDSLSIRTHFGLFVLKILVNSYSFGQFVLKSWSIRTHFGQFVLILVNSYSY